MPADGGCTAGIPFNQTEVFINQIRLVIKTAVLPVVMSKMKGQMFRYHFGMKPKRFGIVPGFVLLKKDCFDLVRNLLFSLLLRQIREQTHVFCFHPD